MSAPEGAPNVLLILTDDVGFGASSTFGGPVPTPTINQLAADGLVQQQLDVINRGDQMAAERADDALDALRNRLAALLH